MDYLWAGLPMVISGGDTLSDLIAAKGRRDKLTAIAEAAGAQVETLSFGYSGLKLRFREGH